MEPTVFAIVDFEGDYGSRLEGRNPEPLGVQGAADEKVHLTLGVSFFRGESMSKLELLMRTHVVLVFLQRGFDLDAKEPLPLVRQ